MFSIPLWLLRGRWLIAAAAIALSACSTHPLTPAPTPPTNTPIGELRSPETCQQRGGTWDTGSRAVPGGLCVAGTAAACTKQGGQWQRICLLGTLACVLPYPDANKACTDASQCTGGRCHQRGEVRNTTGQLVGACIPNNNPCQGAIWIENGQTVPTPIAD